jgi:hypothetical protein
MVFTIVHIYFNKLHHLEEIEFFQYRIKFKHELVNYGVNKPNNILGLHCIARYIDI